MISGILRSVTLAYLVSTSPVVTDINPAFQEYYNQYKEILVAHCEPKYYRDPLNLTLNFRNITRKHLGETTYYDRYMVFHFADIEINKYHWFSRGFKKQRLPLIFHELTHAFFEYPDLKDEIFAHNYMFWVENDVSEQDTIKQFIEILDQTCRDTVR